MSQQTAVEWLINQLSKIDTRNLGNVLQIHEQAKQMEEEEKKKVIVKAWQDGFDTGNYISTTTGGWNGDGEVYYENTYKTQK